MATKPIQGTEIVQNNALDNHISQMKELIDLYDLADEGVKEYAKNTKKIASTLKAGVNDDLKRAVAEEKALTVEIEQQTKRVVARSKAEKSLISLEATRARQRDRAAKQSKVANTLYAAESKRLNDMRREYKELVLAGKKWEKGTRDLKKQINALGGSMERLDSSIGHNYRTIGRYKDALKGLRSGIAQLGLGIGAFELIRSSTDVLNDFDEGLANIAKTTKLTIEGARELSTELLNIDTRTSVSELQELATAAGRLGIEGQDNIVGFVTAADKAFVSLGDDLGGTADEIATTLGKISSLFGGEDEFGIQGGIERTGSAINELSANSKAAAPAILDFTTRLAGVATQANISQQDVMSLGALFDASGQSIEVAATTLNKLLPKLASEQEKYAEVAGLTAEEFSLMLENAPIEALKAVAKGASSSKDGLAGLVETLGDFGVDSARASGIVGILASETEELTRLQGLANNAYEENTSLQDEFALKNETNIALLEKLKKEWDKQILGIGGTTKASNAFKTAVKFLTENLSSILSVTFKLTKAWVVYKATVLAVNSANKASVALMSLQKTGLKSLFISQRATTAATTSAAVAQTGLNTAMKANPIGLLVSGLFLLADALGVFNSGLEDSAKTLREIKAELAEGTAEKQTERQGEINKLLKLSKDEIKQIASGTTEWADEASLLSDILDKGLNNAESKLLFFGQIAKTAKKNVKDLNEEINDPRNFYNKSKLKKELIVQETMADENLKIFRAQLSSMTDEQLKETTRFLDSKYVLEQRIGKFAQFELNTRKEIAEREGETTEEVIKQGSSHKSTAKELTGIAKLQRELNEKEKEKSDILVANKGIRTTNFKILEDETQELEKQIENYKEILKGQEFKPKGSALENDLITTVKGDDSFNLEDELEKERQRLADEEALAAQKIAISQQLTDMIVSQSQKRIEALDAESEAEQKKYDDAVAREQEVIALRTAGVKGMDADLAYQRKIQAQALAEQEKIAKKKQRIELITAGINAFNNQVQQGAENPTSGTINSIGTLISFLSSIPAFWTGTDTTVGDSLGMKMHSGRDGILAKVDKDEIILNKAKSDQLSGMTTDQITRYALAYQNGMSTPNVMSMTAAPIYDNSNLEAKLDANNKYLETIAKKPNSNFSLEVLAGVARLMQEETGHNWKNTKTTHIRFR